MISNLSRLAAFVVNNCKANRELQLLATETLDKELSEAHKQELVSIYVNGAVKEDNIPFERYELLEDLTKLGLLKKEGNKKLAALIPTEFLNLQYELLVLFDLSEGQAVVDSVFLMRKVVDKNEYYYDPNGLPIEGPVRECVQIYGYAGVNNMITEDQIRNLNIGPTNEISLKDFGTIIGLP